MSTDFFLFKKKNFTLKRKKAALTGAPLFCEIEEVKKRNDNCCHKTENAGSKYSVLKTKNDSLSFPTVVKHLLVYAKGIRHICNMNFAAQESCKLKCRLASKKNFVASSNI